VRGNPAGIAIMSTAPVKTLPVRMLLTLSRIPPRSGKRLHTIHVLGMLDEAGHKLHLPKFLQRPICDAWDWYLGVFNDDDVDTGADQPHQGGLPTLAGYTGSLRDQPCGSLQSVPA
jgi:hypothetical protein